MNAKLGAVLLAAVLGLAGWWLPRSGEPDGTPSPAGVDAGVTATTGEPDAGSSNTSPAAETMSPLADAVPHAQTPPKALEQLPQTEQDSLRKAINTAMHSVDPLSVAERAMPQNAGVSHFATNRGQKFNARFRDDGGVTLESGKPDDAWQGTLRFFSGNGGGKWKADGTRVERTAGGVTEWYENRAEGMEHGFTITERPAGAREDSFRLDLDLDGLQAEFDPEREGDLIFTDPATKKAVLGYRGLKIWDATGRALIAHMQPTEPGLGITVRDAGAVYPVTIDPLIVRMEVRAPSTLNERITAADGMQGGSFGYTVALAGNTALIGTPRVDIAGADSGAVYVFTRSGTTWTQHQKLTPADPAANDLFGWCLSMDGDAAIIGAPGKNSAAGAAYTFLRSGTTWTQQQKLTAADGVAGDQYGLAVDLDGITAVVGTPYHNVNPVPETGAAYLYISNGSSWTQQQKLIPGDLGGAFEFGYSVALSGNNVLIGAPYSSGGPDSAGAAYVFVRSGVVWSQQQKITAFDGAEMDLLGLSVAMDGDTAFIGAQMAEEFGGYPGAVYIFGRSGTTWSQQQKLDVYGGRFGHSISLDGNYALIGAPDEVGYSEHTGAAYLYVRGGATWSMQQKLLGPSALTGDMFGNSVALDGPRILIGAPSENDGVVYFSQDVLADPFGLLAADHFGLAVDIDGDTAVIGALDHDLAGVTNAGAAWVLDLHENTWSVAAKLTDSAPLAHDRFGVSVAISGDRVVVGADYDNAPGKTDCGSVSVFERQSGSWVPLTKFSPTAAGSTLGRAVAIDGPYIVSGAPNIGSGVVLAWWGYGLPGATSWLSTSIPSPQNNPGICFGFSVAVSGNRVVVGAPGFDNVAGSQSTPNCGLISFHTLTNNGTALGSTSDLQNVAPVENAGTGFSVAIDGDTAVVGCCSPSGWFSGSGGGAPGLVLVYTHNGFTWSDGGSAVLNDSGFTTPSYFGSSVAVNGGVIAVGAFGNGSRAGKVRVFRKEVSGWVDQTDLSAPLGDGNNTDCFGISTALSGKRLITGAYGVRSETGAAYVFGITDPDETPPVLTITRIGGNMVLTWDPSPVWSLQRDDDLQGVWTETNDNDGSFTYPISSAPRMFFRLSRQ